MSNNKYTEDDYCDLIPGGKICDNCGKCLEEAGVDIRAIKIEDIAKNVEENKFYDKLRQETGFDKDPRVKFVGTVYDQELLKYIRENAFAYFHGHEVGGTNPSLLEALESTKLNLLLDVGFNREVGEDGALYWKKDQLASVINQAEQLDEQAIADLNQKSSKRIEEAFTWEKIVTDYEKVFKG